MKTVVAVEPHLEIYVPELGDYLLCPNVGSKGNIVVKKVEFL